MRWLTEDPVKDGGNWYIYCGGDPVNYIDPLGLCKETDFNIDWSQVDFINKDIDKSNTIAPPITDPLAAIGLAAVTFIVTVMANEDVMGEVAEGISNIYNIAKEVIAEARKQIFKHFPTKKEAKDARDKVGSYQEDGKTQGSEKHKPKSVNNNL